MGITDKDFLRQLGEDGTTTFVFKFQGDRLTLLRRRGGARARGRRHAGLRREGRRRDDQRERRLPRLRLHLRLVAGRRRAHLDLVGHESTDTPEDVVIVRFVTEGAFTRTS